MGKSRRAVRNRRGRSEHLIDRVASNIEHGRFERSLSGLTAVAALVTTSEVYLEHYRASFGNKMMWSPIVVTPPVIVAGIGGVFSRHWAKRYLPVAAIAYTANGLLGEYCHARGIARRPVDEVRWTSPACLLQTCSIGAWERR